MSGRDDDSDGEDEDLENYPWSRQELRDRAEKSMARRRRVRRTEAPAQQAAQPGLDLQKSDAELAGAGGNMGAGGEQNAEHGYDEMVAGRKGDGDDESLGSDDTDMEDDVGPTDEEINEIFLKRYKMSKEDLQGMADKMGIQLNNLCYLKQEFDAYDEDRSGYIDVKELKGLLEKLGEELSDEELDQAFQELDSDGSGEIEFFEFVAWFTSED